uniref:D-isomer specific 2-hydroxyacid dehydrogenase NAD-binding domain-containing protein n=1 Tax=Araucaria cunninghamii TaxID=56994 RepID=A0A0D6RB77_ARACU
MAGSNDDSIATRIIFCGVGFPTSFEYTKQYLLPYPFIQVDAVPFDEVPDKIGSYHICVVRGMRLDSKVIARAKQMKLIVQYGVGLEGVDIEAATEFGIKVARIPSSGTGNSLSCAEHAIYLILGLLRDQKGMEQAFKEKRLGEPTGETLYGKTVFIVGYGNIGRDLAVRLRPFGVKILAIRRSWGSNSAANLTKLDAVDTSQTQSTDKGYIDDNLVDEKGGSDRLLEFASQADIVVTCCLLNTETVGIVNAKFLSSMKKGAYIINISRGALMDYEAVKASLEAGHLGGLGLDVAWFEPFDPADPILQHPKVLITPHIAGITEMSYRNMAKVVGECAMSLHKGEQFHDIEIVN